MRILFICGSFEQGRDGVGDYTARLASKLNKKGHNTVIIALNDKHVIEKKKEVQQTEGAELSVFRLPMCLKNAERRKIAKQLISDFNPDVISLQFVIFAFHPKGLPLNLSKLLADVGANRRWHIMFHELWVGMAENDSIKRKLWGNLQKHIILRLIKKLKPAVIHTQCELFYKQLNNKNIRAIKLPLFSNIDIYSSSLTPHFKEKYLSEDNKLIKFIFFGGLHPHSKLQPLIDMINPLFKNRNIGFEFLYVGRNGQELNNHTTILNDEKIKYTVFGELPSSDLSYLLSISSYGVSTGSPEMLEKNGTVAAMIAHKLPVICIGRDLNIITIEGLTNLAGVYFLTELEQVFSQQPALGSPVALSKVANQFINDLELNN